jgi:3-keto-disaccharide hydrolase
MRFLKASIILAAMFVAAASVVAQQTKVDLGKETVGKPPAAFEPMMGSWIIAQDGADKVVKVDGVAYKLAQDTPTRMLLENARKFYGTSNEELMDNAKQFASFPIAVLRSVNNFSNGTISLKFKTVAGDADRASGILFNVKPNGDWLCVRYNDTEHNVALWEFHNGVRRRVFGAREQVLTDPADRDKWHEFALTIDGANLKTTLNGATILEYTLGAAPGPGRNGAAPNAELIPANNPVLRPPVNGKVGLWSKTDSTSYFKDYVVIQK